MAKDPALLWYPGDWTQGTQLFTFEEKGAYMTLLMIQFETGSLSIEDIKYVLGVRFDTIWNRICSKFKQDEDGRYYQWRIREEKVKRVKFTESRKKNLSKPHMDDHMKPHMADHMENENRNIDNSTNSSNVQYSKNMIHGKNYVESHTMMERAIKAFRDNGLIATEENVKLICKKYITEIDAKMEDKQTLKLFAEHFISWAKMHGKKYQPQSKSRIGL